MNHIADIPKQKRKGEKMARAALLEINFQQTSNFAATNVVRQQVLSIIFRCLWDLLMHIQKFLKSLGKRLKTDDQKSICSQLEQFRTVLCDPKYFQKASVLVNFKHRNMRIQVICDVVKLKDPKGPWEHFLPSQYNRNYLKELKDVHFAQEHLSASGINGGQVNLCWRMTNNLMQKRDA